MRRLRLAALLVVVCATLVGVPGVAPAGPPGTWTRITPLNLRNIDEFALHRTGDGRLHVFWVRDEGQNDASIVDQIFSEGGDKGATRVAANSWFSAGEPDVVGEGSGMRLFFGGFHTGDRDDPNQNLNTMTAPSAGTPWTLQEGTVVDNDQAYAGDIGAGTALNGTDFQSWANSSSVFVHRGLDPETPNHDFQTTLGGCCGARPEIVTDQDTGRVWLVWHSGNEDRRGIFARPVNPDTGAPMGSPQKMPGTTTEFGGVNSTLFSNARTPVASRPNRPGAFVAYAGGYPVSRRVLVWRIGANSSTTVASSDQAHDNIGIASDRQGRVWALWTEERVRDNPRIYARRSNPAVTRWGEVVSIRPPAGTTQVWKMAGNASATRLDVVVTSENANGIAGWHSQIRPGLSLSASPQRFTGRETVRFTVRDAGVPVRDALVRAGGKSERTNSNGVAEFALGPYDSDRRVVATASKAGFVADSLTLRINAPN